MDIGRKGALKTLGSCHIECNLDQPGFPVGLGVPLLAIFWRRPEESSGCTWVLRVCATQLAPNQLQGTEFADSPKLIWLKNTPTAAVSRK